MRNVSGLPFLWDFQHNPGASSGSGVVKEASELDPFEPIGGEKNSIAVFAAASIETAALSRSEEVVIFFITLSTVDLNLEFKVGDIASLLRTVEICLLFESRKRFGGQKREQETKQQTNPDCRVYEIETSFLHHCATRGSYQ